MKRIQSVRKSGLTFAPEAGTQRLRDVINKNITEDAVINTAKTAFSGGNTSVKLYFMLGLPTETFDDVAGIGNLAQKVVDTFYSLPERPKGRGHRVGQLLGLCAEALYPLSAGTSGRHRNYQGKAETSCGKRTQPQNQAQLERPRNKLSRGGACPRRQAYLRRHLRGL